MNGDIVHDKSYASVAKQTIAARVALIGMNIAYIVLLAVLLGAQNYGILSVAIATSLVFLHLSLAGTNWSLGIEVAREPKREAQLIGQYLSVRLVTASIAFLACVSWGILALENEVTGWLIACFAIALLPRSLAMIHIAALLGRGDAHIATTREASVRFLEILVILTGIVLFDLSLFWIAIVNILAWTALSIWLRCHIVKIQWPRNILKALGEVSLKGAPFGILGAEITWLTQSAILNAPSDISPVQAIGWIALAVNMVTVVLALLQSILAPMAPQLAQSARDGNRIGPDTLASGICAGVTIGLVADVSIRLLGPLLLPALIGPGYLGVAAIHTPIAWMVAALFTMTLCSSLIGYHNRTWLAAFLTLLGIATTMLLLTFMPEKNLPAATIIAAAGGATVTTLALASFHVTLTKNTMLSYGKGIGGLLLVGATLGITGLVVSDFLIHVEIASAVFLTIVSVRLFPKLG